MKCKISSKIINTKRNKLDENQLYNSDLSYIMLCISHTSPIYPVYTSFFKEQNIRNKDPGSANPLHESMRRQTCYAPRKL